MCRYSPFKIANLGGKSISLHVGLRVKYRKTEMFLFFCIFGDRDEDSIVGIKKERKTLISCRLVTLGQVLGCRYAMMDPKDLL